MPRHYGWDSFRIKHPPMPASRWAKIYAPFDALKGFDEAIEAQEELFVCKPDLGEFEKEELDRRLGILARLTRNGKEARKNQVMATVKYFEGVDGGQDCEELGKIRKLSGQVWSVDAVLTHTIRINEELIDMADLLSVESPVFEMFDDVP
ncbi:MAG: hypothetical protein IJ058_14380 [Lachnospiraceae bacterium]|nr:hypothetical protein [Lachnospiraceae bacterium]MBQ8947968.1 hypothetical protein [Lachnospiraceae bacterium]